MFSDRKETFENRVYLAVQDIKLKAYVECNIRALECNRLVLNDKEWCECGRHVKDHKCDKDESGRPWNKKNDLKEMVSNAFGEMKLSGFRVLAGIHLKYIRAAQTEGLCEHLYYIMTELWNFQKPELIISINGGAKKMIPLSNEQKSAFKRGLMNVSKAASTWIITGGFNFGVSKLVGEAARDHNIASQEKPFTVLGIGTWGAVFNRQDLLVKENVKKTTYNNADGQFTLKGQAPLDPNHDAFVLFDSGIEGVFGMEIQFRTEFEIFISRKAKCSVVQVIVEGGKKCIVTADEALLQGIPVVVMKGSKRAADLICDVIESDKTVMTDIIKEGISDYKTEWSIATDKEFNDLCHNLKSLYGFREKNLIHIFSMSDFTKNLDRAILEAAFSGHIDNKELTYDERLRLAMTFNRPDVAEESILESSTSRTQFADYGEYIKNALIKNQWKFVNLFLSRGTQVESFLTKKLLEDLYFGKEVNKYINPNTSNILRFLKDNARRSNQNQLSTIGLIVRKLTKNLINNIYSESKSNSGCCGQTNVIQNQEPEDYKISDYEKYIEPILETKNKKISNGSCCSCQYETITKQYMYTKHPPQNKVGQRIYTEQDLFIWGLLTQRWEMAKIFWEIGKDHIGSALLGCVICRSLSKIANKEGEVEMATTLENYQQEFEGLAINILTEAYWRDKTRTHLLLIRALPYWSRVTCMEIANKSYLINFLSQSACQTRLNAIWLGGMSMYTNTFLFLLNLPFAFLTSKLLIFRSRRTDDYTELSSMDASETISNGMLKDGIFEDILNKTKSANKDYGKSHSSRKHKEYLTKFRQQQQIAWKNVSFCEAVSFYYNAPITKFTLHIISYLLFLTIYSYMCLVELLPLTQVTTVSQRQMEYAVYVYIASFVLEEIRQSVTGNEFDTIRGKMIEWISSLWNIFDIFLYVFFFIAVILRHITTIDFVYARTLFSVSLSMFFLRFLQFYYANRSLGPKVISVSRMIKDIVFFLALYVIAIFSYGTFAQALLFSNSPINGFLLKNIMYMPYWQSYGDLHIDYVEGTAAVNNVNPTPNAIVIVGFAFYILFTNALLMNMLVAMFGFTFAKVEDNSNKIWAFNRYQLIEEFYFRPILPPPLNFIEIIWMVFHECKSLKKHLLKRNDFVVNLYYEEDIRSSGFEQQCLETYLLENPILKPVNDADETLIKTEKNETSTKTSESENRIITEKLIETMNELKIEMKSQATEMKGLAAEMHKVRRHQKKENRFGQLNKTISIQETIDET